MGIHESRIRNYPHEFSGGMRQRIMIALAVVLNPSLLIADEPTTSLDVIVEAQILQILQDLKRVYKMSLMLITHNLGIVAEVSDRVAVLYAGKLAEVGPVRDVFHRTIHPYTQGLLSSIIHLETKDLHSIDGTPPDLVDPPTGCRFHPRCPYAQTICSEKVPPLQEYRPGHFAACHFGDTFV
jgi:peptide/nickel transport system ATP-binding protein